MVDLSVVGLLVALRYLSLRGVHAAQMRSATRLMHVSGLLTLALNIAEPLAAGHYGRAAVDAVAPLLLLGWGAVGPQLLRAFHTVTTTHTAPAPAPADDPAPAPATAPANETAPASAPAPTVVEPRPQANPAPVAAPTPATAPVAPRPAAPAQPPAAPAVKVPEPLLIEARSIAESHRTMHGEPITATQLKRRLGVGLPMATALHTALSA
ncbi:SpdA protein [Streptomyces sp. NEAU-L66]|uniref:SpdA protein n=1 Tax=Streptomyces sp. NEAU-L66 TaxID=3390812 RepID=UPI0039C63378